MKTFSNLLQRSFLLAALPAALAFSSCGDDDSPAPAPDQGRLMIVNGAAGINVGVKVLADEAEKAQLTYGQNSGYQNLNTGPKTFKVNVASSGQNVVTAPSSLSIDKDKSYSLFLYTPNATTAGSALHIADDLTAPASRKAKVRLVNLSLASTGPLRLSQQLAVGYSDIIPDVAFPSASNFIEINEGPLNLAVSAGNPSLPVYQVGDGSGSGTGTKTYTAGKIYTIVVSGDANNLDPVRKPKAYIVENN